MPVGAPVDLSTSRGHADAHTRPLTAHTGCRIAPDNKRKGRKSDDRLRNMSNFGRLEPKAGSWQGTDLKTSARQSLSPHFRQQPAGKLSALRLAFEHRACVLPLGRWQRRKPKGPADIPRPPSDHRQSRHPAPMPSSPATCRQPLRPRSPGLTECVPLQDQRDPPSGAAGEHARRRRGARTLAKAPRHTPLQTNPRPEPNPLSSLSRRTASLQPRHP
jgi:hypothetical protein